MKKPIIVIVAVCVTFALATAIYSLAQYNPYRKLDVQTNAFAALTSVLSPEVSQGVVDTNTYKHPFGVYDLGFSIGKTALGDNAFVPQNAGKIRYSGGKTELLSYDDNLGLGDLTHTQKFFTEGREDISVSGGDIYIRFSEELTVIEFLDRYRWLADALVKRKDDGLRWFAIRTSNDDNAVCLGVEGNLSFNRLQKRLIVEPWFDYYYMVDDFQQTLKYLAQNETAVRYLLKTGLWKGAEDVDFAKAYQYTADNGIKIIGAYVSVSGATLQAIRESDGIVVIQN